MVYLQKMIEGRECLLCALAGQNDCPTLDFLNDLKRDNEREYVKIMAYLARTADHGPPVKNKEKCRYFPQLKAFELKTTGGVRIMAFWDADRLIVCSHGFMKRSRKTPKEQLTRLTRSREQYFDAQSRNAIVWKKD